MGSKDRDSVAHCLPLPFPHQMPPQSLSLHKAAPYVHCGCRGVEVGAGYVVSARRGVSPGGQWSGVQPAPGILSQQRGTVVARAEQCCMNVSHMIRAILYVC